MLDSFIYSLNIELNMYYGQAIFTFNEYNKTSIQSSNCPPIHPPTVHLLFCTYLSVVRFCIQSISVLIPFCPSDALGKYFASPLIQPLPFQPRSSCCFVKMPARVHLSPRLTVSSSEETACWSLGPPHHTIPTHQVSMTIHWMSVCP